MVVAIFSWFKLTSLRAKSAKHSKAKLRVNYLNYFSRCGTWTDGRSITFRLDWISLAYKIEIILSAARKGIQDKE